MLCRSAICCRRDTGLLVLSPVDEAEINAENNYMWPDAVKVARAHKAHIMVAVLGKEEKLLEKGKLFTKRWPLCCQPEIRHRRLHQRRGI